MSRFILLLCCVLLLSACGFEPVYSGGGVHKDGTAGAPAASTATKLATIKIGNIPDRQGQILRNMLIDRLQPRGLVSATAGAAQYTLVVEKFDTQSVDLGVAKNASATRAQMRQNIRYALKDEAGRTLLSRYALAIGTYDTLGSQYKNIVTANDVMEQTLGQLADQMTEQVELFVVNKAVDAPVQ